MNSIAYGVGRIDYQVFDAPSHSLDVLRVAFRPERVVVDGRELSLRDDLACNGYTLRQLVSGDWMVSIRHDGATSVWLIGPDAHESHSCRDLQCSGDWKTVEDSSCQSGAVRVACTPARATWKFQGNQLRVIGNVDPLGGLADVFLDGVKQMTPIDCWTPSAAKHQQVLFYRSGLAQGTHHLTIAARGEHNVLSRGNAIYLDALLVSTAKAGANLAMGSGPLGAQRMIFGYPKRQPYVDSAGQEWLPATEFVVRSGHNTDSVAQAWWTEPSVTPVGGTEDTELYRYGVHGGEFWVNLTVGPGVYQVRLKFAETRPGRHLTTIRINGQERIQSLDVAASAGGRNTAYDVVYKDVRPRGGVIEVRFVGADGGEAMVQALELTAEPPIR